MFETLKEAQRWIEGITRFGDKYDLSRMERAVKLLDHPEKTFKTVHIGGTNGKGSTLTYLKEILLEAGYKVGTFTSPYVVSFNERITLNNEPIADEDLLFYINKIQDFQASYREKHHDQITFFELVTLVSFLYFRDRDVDYVLYEVGLGGTLDATNVIMPELAIITTVGYDHMHVLGDTLEEIAENKLGIVKANVPLVAGGIDPALEGLFAEHAQKQRNDLHLIRDHPARNIHPAIPTTFTLADTAYTLSMIGLHQVENARTALLAADVLKDKENLHISPEAKKKGLLRARFPGRMERFGENVLLDGAHNISSLEATIASMRAYFPKKRIRVLFAVMADKDYTPMLRLLEDFADELFFTEIPYHRAEKAENLAKKTRHPRAKASSDYREAYDEALDKDEKTLLLITGSLYFISAIRTYILDKSAPLQKRESA